MSPLDIYHTIRYHLNNWLCFKTFRCFKSYSTVFNLPLVVPDNHACPHEQIKQKKKESLLYTLPNFSNPSVCKDFLSKTALIEIVEKYLIKE